MNKILLYKKVENTIQQSIEVANPNFQSNADGWDYSGPDWSYNSVNEQIELNQAGGYTSIKTVFAVLPTELVYYDIVLDCSFSGTGTVEVFIGNTSIYSGTSLTSTTLLYQTPIYDQYSIPNSFTIKINGIMSGYLSSFAMIRNQDLSPLVSTDTWEETGYLDLYDDINIALNFTKENLQQFSEKQIVSTKEFVIPGTENNNTLLGHLYENGSEIVDFNPRIKNRAKILTSEGNTILDGWLLLNEIIKVRDKIEYSCQILDKSFGLLDSLKSGKLKDLDLSAYDHQLTLDNVVDTFVTGRTWTDAYFYPILFKQDVNERYLIANDFYPVIFDRFIFDQIHKANQIPYSLSPLTQEWMDRLVTTPNGRRPNITAKDIELSSTYSKGFFATYFDEGRLNSSIPPDTERQASQFTQLYNDNYNQLSTVTDDFTPNQGGKYNITVEYAGTHEMFDSFINPAPPFNPIPITTLTIGQQTPNTNVSYLKIGIGILRVEDNIIVSEKELYYTTTYNPGVVDLTQTIIFDDVELELNKSYKIITYVNNYLTFTYTGLFLVNYITPSTNLIAIGDNFFYFELSELSTIQEGSLIQLNDFLPNVSQIDFINDKIKQFNLLIFESGGTYNYVTENEFYSDGKEVIDLTGKVDTDSEINIRYLSQITSNSVNFKYQDAEDYWNVEYNKLTKNIPYHFNSYSYDTNIFSKTDTIELKIYEPTPIVANNIGDVFPALPSNEYPKKSRNLFLSDDKLNFVSGITIQFTTDTGDIGTFPLTERYTMLHIDNLNLSTKDIGFGAPETTFTPQAYNITVNNLVNTFYDRKLNTYKNSRLITCNIWLNNRDVRELLNDPGRRIYIQELNKYFILQSIEDYDIENGDKQLTKVELLEYLALNNNQEYYKSTYNTSSTISSPFDLGGLNIKNIVLGNSNNYGTNNFINKSGNTIFGNSVFIYGEDNIVQAYHENIFLFGVNSYSSVTSNYANFFGVVEIGLTGMTTPAIQIGTYLLNETTIAGLSADTYTVSGTYSAGTLTLLDNDGNTISITGFSQTPSTDIYVTGGTYSNGTLTFTNNTGTTFNVTGLYTGATDVYVTGGTYSAGTTTITNNTGGTFTITGYTVDGDAISYYEFDGVNYLPVLAFATPNDPYLTIWDDGNAGKNYGFFDSISNNLFDSVVAGRYSGNTLFGGGSNLLGGAFSVEDSTIIGGKSNIINNLTGTVIQSSIIGSESSTIRPSTTPFFDTTRRGTILGSLNSHISGGTSVTIIGANDSQITQTTSNSGTSIYSGIVLGAAHRIYNGNQYSSIFGGNSSNLYSSEQATIIGGSSHVLSGSNLSTIVGGSSNLIAGGTRNIVLGGRANDIESNSNSSAILAGLDNELFTCSASTAIGCFNIILSSTTLSTMIGLSNLTRTTSNRLFSTDQEYVTSTPTFVAPIGWSGTSVGTNMGGVIDFTTDTNNLGPNTILISIIWTQAFTTNAPVVLQPANQAAASIRTYVTSTSSGTLIYAIDALSGNTNYKFNYVTNPF